LREIFETNVFGWHSLTRAVLPVMRAQGHGRILQCSSVLGFVAMPWRGAYIATKHALEGLTDTLRLELRDTNIHVVLIEPGPIRTKIRENAIVHFEKWIDWKASARAAQYEATLMKKLYKGSQDTPFELGPDAVAEVLWTAVTAEAPAARYRVTTPTHIMAGLKRVLPNTWLDSLLARGG
jgi:NAD(P)-dependent dehydrogenase (short-subunit alcohol dehydrogenase family)